ncbi:hypothetical protein BX600DRAFT_164867 [Xylariales sp. PMI_506]|nr:hypothetical protein BX600DRAFT_164867 [Xylariales sp. PMI_506]
MVSNIAHHSTVLRTLIFFVSTLSQPARAGTTPVAATWSSEPLGPDGPWPAVEVEFGGKQKLPLYPGHDFETFVVYYQGCTNTSDDPYLYDCSPEDVYEDGYITEDSGSSDGILWSPTESNFMTGLLLKYGNEGTISWVDDVDLLGGTAIIPNVSMAVVTDAQAVYPGGLLSPLTVGCLGLGAPKSVNQTFSLSPRAPGINASLIPGYQWSHDEIASNSFGMHIGAVNPPVPGSLYFGGYDQDRLVGPIVTSAGFDDGSGVIKSSFQLKDISIDVISGSSPFTFNASATGLLSKGNSSLDSGVDVRIDGCSPYLSLPSSVCKAIAGYLPVTYSEDLGLWLWNTSDLKYAEVVSSASALGFTISGSTGDDATISVPFRHLNLTLDSPLVETPQPYFPCYDGPVIEYTLGRAFLQDAFFGANWGESVWWLAQAPGPKITTATIVTIEVNDTSITPSGNDWADSWSDSWVALTPAQANSSANISVPTYTGPAVTTTTVAPPEATGNSASSVMRVQDITGIGFGIAWLWGVLYYNSLL